MHHFFRVGGSNSFDYFKVIKTSSNPNLLLNIYVFDPRPNLIKNYGSYLGTHLHLLEGDSFIRLGPA